MGSTPVYVVSGGHAASGSLLLRTALAQFDGAEPVITVIPRVRRREQVEEIVAEAHEAGALIVHTFVDVSLRRYLISLATLRGVLQHDAMGLLLEVLSAHLGQGPLGIPGRYLALQADDLRRSEAIAFAVSHDDGCGTDALGGADVVVVGLSRAGKTPLCMYLAVQGWKAANVPLVPDLPLPPAVLALDRKRVVGLVVGEEQLLAYRLHRRWRLGPVGPTRYALRDSVHGECEYARQLFRRHHIATVDVTNKALEESAEEVLSRVGFAAEQAR